MQEAPLETVRHLSERKIAWPEKIDKSRWSWVHRISTVESMRWAINTVSKTTAELSKLIGSDSIAPLHGVSEARLQMLLAIRKERAEQNGT
jgi:C4-dicarboxylate-specific signal transduction histidine kinase